MGLDGRRDRRGVSVAGFPPAVMVVVLPGDGDTCDGDAVDGGVRCWRMAAGSEGRGA